MRIIKLSLRHSLTDCALVLLIGNLRFDDDNVNDNATNQWFDWLNEER